MQCLPKFSNSTKPLEFLAIKHHLMIHYLMSKNGGCNFKKLRDDDDVVAITKKHD